MTAPRSPASPADSVPPRPTIVATEPCLAPPYWALAERSLFNLLDAGWRMFADHYTRADGSLRYDDRLTTRDGADDFFEPFFNWPQLYLLGGADDLLEASAKHWHGLVRQLTDLGMLRDEFEIGYDWFHQGESLLFFYFLTMADPAAWRERAIRFADLYVDPAGGNYDAEHRIVTAPTTAVAGPGPGCADDGAIPGLPAEAAQYGFPLDWLGHAEEALAAVRRPPAGSTRCSARLGTRRRGRQPQHRRSGPQRLPGHRRNRGTRPGCPTTSGRGGERAAANGGSDPGQRRAGRRGRQPARRTLVRRALRLDLAARDVQPGPGHARRCDGRPLWPRATTSYLDLPRALLDAVIAQGRQLRFADSDSSISARWRAHLGPAVEVDTLLIPYRHSDRGWFDWNPVQTSVPMALWHYSSDPMTPIAWTRCAKPVDTTGPTCDLSATRKKPATRNPGMPTSAATIPITPRPSWPWPTSRLGAGSNCCAATPTGS